MKFWVLLVALTLLAGCGAELSPPSPSRLWGFLGALGEAAENATERIRESPLALRLQTAIKELRELRVEAQNRLAEYGAEARALLELSAADLRARGSAFARKLRKRLSRDQEELRKRWEGGAAALRGLWVWSEPPRVLSEPLRVEED